MAARQFVQRCRSRNDLRPADVTEFLQLMGKAFGVECWVHRGEKIEVEEPVIEGQLKSHVDPEVPGAGATWLLSSQDEESPIVVLLATGSDEWGRDFFDVDFSREQLVPDLSFFRLAIELCRPFEAFISEDRNEADLNAHEKQQLLPNFERPAILRWFHYLGSPLVESVGGFEHCLRTPAFRVERFCEGVLFQLIEEPFEAENPEHRRRQIRAMRHLGLD